MNWDKMYEGRTNHPRSEAENVQLNNVKKITKIKKESGPILVLVKVNKGGAKSNRVDISPPNIKNRFMKSLKQK